MRFRLRTLLPLGRWLRFSLRTLFLLTLIFAACLGIAMKRLRDRKNAIAAIESSGGTMGVDLAGPEWLRKLIGDEECFWDPIRVSLGPIARQSGRDAPSLDDASLRRLAPVLKSFHSLEVLDIRGSAVTDHSADLLASLTGLKHLRLSETHITNDTIRQISRLSQLESLALYGAPITDDCIDDLCHLANLTNMDIRRTAITGDGLTRLRHELPRCTLQAD